MLLRDRMLKYSTFIFIIINIKQVVSESAKELRAECQMWAHLENKSIPFKDDGQANCTTNTDCTGFSCEGTFKDSVFTIGIRIHNCQDPPGVEIFGNAPKFHQASFSHIFQHDERYEIPETIQKLKNLPGLPSLPMAGQGLNGTKLYFKMNLVPNNVNRTFNTLKIGLEMEACVNHSMLAGILNANVRKSKDLEGGELCILKKPLISDAIIPVPHCKAKYPAKAIVGNSCDVTDLYNCGDHMTCIQQMEDDNAGLCECLSEYRMNPDKTCGPAYPKNSRVPRKTEPQPQTAAESESGGGAGVAVGIISFLLVLALLCATAFMAHRHRLIPRLRAKMRNTPYEDIIIEDTIRPKV